MDVKNFYENTALRNSSNSNNLIPKPVSFVGKWGSKTRIQTTYEMLSSYAPFENLLDLGCGDLTNLITLENLFKKGFGVDIATYPTWKPLEERLITCQHNLDAGSLPFSDQMFDAVTILMVLEHIFDPFKVIEEISRITKPKGYLVINVPNIANIKHRFELLFGQFPITSSVNCWELREWDGGHIHYFTLERLIWLLGTFGNYQVLQIQGSGKFAPLKRLRPGLLCSDLQLLCQKVA